MTTVRTGSRHCDHLLHSRLRCRKQSLRKCHFQRQQQRQRLLLQLQLGVDVAVGYVPVCGAVDGLLAPNKCSLICVDWSIDVRSTPSRSWRDKKMRKIKSLKQPAAVRPVQNDLTMLACSVTFPLKFQHLSFTHGTVCWTLRRIYFFCIFKHTRRRGSTRGTDKRQRRRCVKSLENLNSTFTADLR